MGAHARDACSSVPMHMHLQLGMGGGAVGMPHRLGGHRPDAHAAAARLGRIEQRHRVRRRPHEAHPEVGGAEDVEGGKACLQPRVVLRQAHLCMHAHAQHAC